MKLDSRKSDNGVTEDGGARASGRLADVEQLVSLLNEKSEIRGGMALWWQQLCAVTRLRFLKLKYERKSIVILILILGIGLLHILSANVHRIVNQSDYCWELAPHMYFLTPGQQPQVPLTNLLIVNKTGAKIDDFIHSLEQQNIALEVDAFGTRNGTEDIQYNGAIILSGDEKNYNFTLACNTKRLNCFPVLVDIVSNGLLGLFAPSAHIQTDRSTFLKVGMFLISSRSDRVFNNPEEPDGEDEDVGLERVWTANALTSADFHEKPAIIASCLRKEYKEKKKCFVLKSKKKIATRNISFCVRKGEVVGLLGHNGAGKSTTIKLITGETKPSSGQVLLKGNSTGDTLGFLGYCPQENALWLNLTVREHLEIFAAVKGMKKSDVLLSLYRLADALKLQDQLKSPVKTLSEGVKRKLCFVLSILGNPSVVLLDEPSTGMDPEGQQQMWQAIQATFTNTDRGALLTTHYMAEAEAVCDRVAIMVSGRLRCIGSIQHLKSKFGKEYLLEMKVKTPTQVEPLNMEIMRLFPQAARQERYSSLMVYKLPREDVQPLSQAFFKLETVKQNFDLEEYSLSQSTLEQVFLELSKEQELDGFEEELDPSVKWKLLPQEET
ncbi:ABC-type organic anion transporter ABCA8A-like [Apodemus sylvaticus]|uniref:ABC-type organic anion transporter ABCA8A-like n=1 Tax=Apodemus sylvaticus TaxID=10129 RepID=UPI002241E4F2|nr:ABC-type organic anion transporter ABCA8A-like [Apodemus sylvaticus]